MCTTGRCDTKQIIKKLYMSIAGDIIKTIEEGYLSIIIQGLNAKFGNKRRKTINEND